jgi:amino acid permease
MKKMEMKTKEERAQLERASTRSPGLGPKLQTDSDVRQQYTFNGNVRRATSPLGESLLMEGGSPADLVDNNYLQQKLKYHRAVATQARGGHSPHLNPSPSSPDMLALMHPPAHVLPPHFYVPLIGYTQGQVQGSVGFILTVCNTMMGSTLLCLPYAFQIAGIGAGTLLTLIFGMIAYYTCALILKWGAQPQRFFEDFSDLCEDLLGRWARRVATATSVAILLGAMACYHVLMASMLQSVAEDIVAATGADPARIRFGSGNTEYALPAVLITSVCLVVMQIRDISTLAKLASYGVIALVYNVTLMVGAGIWNLIGLTAYSSNDFGNVKYFGNSGAQGKMVGMMGLSLFVHSVLLPLAANHEQIRDRPNVVKRDLGIAYSICTLVYIVVGAVPSMSFMLGHSIQPVYKHLNIEVLPQNALMAFPGDHMWAVIGKSLLVLQIGTVYPILGAVARKQFCVEYFQMQDPSARVTLLCNLVMAGMTTSTAALYPYPANVVGLVGAYTAVVYMLGLPIAVHLQAVKRAGNANICGAALHFLLFGGGSLMVMAQFFLTDAS